jgi:hypothetical protein
MEMSRRAQRGPASTARHFHRAPARYRTEKLSVFPRLKAVSATPPV